MVAEASNLAHLEIAEPIVRFDASQKRFFLDEARVIVVVWHRQKGKDFTAAAKAVADAAETGRPWYIVSLTQRQADATFDKCKFFVNEYKKRLKIRGKVQYGEREYVEYDKAIDQHFVCKAREIVLPNGAKIISLPGRDPDTLAGLTGNVIFTEFGLFPNGGYDHWRVVFPLATRGFQVVVISTPRGKNSKFFELFSDNLTYSVHFCDIYKSVAEDGFILRDNKGEPCSLETFKQLYGDDAGWDREYGCNFTGDLDSLIRMAQLLAAGELGRDMDFSYLRVEKGNGWEENFFKANLPHGGRLEMGWDVARRGHISSLWVNHARPRDIKRLRYLVLMHNTEFALQRHVIMAAMDAMGRGTAVGCGDNTGLGMDSNETLQRKYRDRWEPVDFTGKTKSELASIGRTTYGDGGQAIPPLNEHKFIATDIYAIQCQEEGGQGKEKRLKLAESENPLLTESHCDIAYSNFMALRAGLIRSGMPLRSFARKPVGC